MVVVSGIGCTARTSGYFETGSFHTTHGRAVAFASGVKIADPELMVIVVSGNGDIAAIGGNHLIHACRRTSLGSSTRVFDSDFAADVTSSLWTTCVASCCNVIAGIAEWAEKGEGRN